MNPGSGAPYVPGTIVGIVTLVQLWLLFRWWFVVAVAAYVVYLLVTRQLRIFPDDFDPERDALLPPIRKADATILDISAFIVVVSVFLVIAYRLLWR